MQSHSSNPSTGQDTVQTPGLPEHKRLSWSQNVMLTIKVSAIAGILLAAIWAFDTLVN